MKTWTLVAGLAAILGSGACRASEGAGAFEEAQALFPLLTSDVDVEARTLLAFADGACHAGCPDLAVGAIRRIRDWRRGVGAARVADAMMRTGRVRDAQSLLEEAGRCANDYPNSWQAGLIHARRAAVLVQLDRTEEARALVELLPNDDVALGRMLFALGLSRVGKVVEAEALLGEPALAGTGPPAEAQASAYAELARHADDPSRQAMFWRRAIRASIENCDVSEPGALLREALNCPAAAAVLREKAPNWLAVAEGRARSLSPMLECKAVMIARLSVCRSVLGDPGVARGLLEEAASGIESLQRFERPMALSAVAKGRYLVGDGQRAETLWLDAARQAAGHQTARLRASGLIAVLLDRISAGSGRSGAISGLVARVAEDHGRDEAVANAMP